MKTLKSNAVCRIRYFALLMLLTILGTGQVWGEGTETFENASSSTSYGSVSWTGVNGCSWSATNARTDQKITGSRGLTFKASTASTITMVLTDAQKTAGLGVLTFNYKYPYSDSGKKRILSITIGSSTYSSGDLAYTSSSTSGSITVNSTLSSNTITINVDNNGGRICVDDFSWTSYGSSKYTVTYDANGATSGSVPTDATEYTSSSNTVTVLGNTGSLAKTGYNFAGWNTKDDGTGTNYTAGNTFTISANTTLYAKWTAINYTVTWKVNGTTVKTETVAYNSTATLPENPNPASYCGDKFMGWTTTQNYDAASAPSMISSAPTITGDVTYYAVFGYYEQ